MSRSVVDVGRDGEPESAAVATAEIEECHNKTLVMPTSV
jgi:hypothetical protein